MDKLQRALARKTPEPVAEPPQVAVEKKPAKADPRTITSLRIDPGLLIRLKVAAAREQVRTNALIVDAIRDRVEMLERRHRQGEAA